MPEGIAHVRCPRCGSEAQAGASFCPTCGSPLSGAVAGGGSRAETDELKPVTALFADIVGSTSLGERLAPDEVKALIGECVNRMSRAVEDFGGIVQAYEGDGIAAYFGVPFAHEDDPERAARAALRILDLVQEYGGDIEAAWSIAGFNVRVGINSGQTAVGAIGSGDPQTVALGDTTNVAARLQSAAEPGTIVAGEGSAARLAHSFVLEPLGELTLKGRASSVTAWRLLGLRETGAAAPTTPLVDREAEMAQLRSVCDDLKAGRGQTLALVGEAGIGKTRLLGELRDMAAEDVNWLEGKCPSYGDTLLYWPFVEMLRNWLGAGQAEGEVAVRMKLRARVGGLFEPRASEVLPYLGRLLSLKVDPEAEEGLQRMPPEELAREIKRATCAVVERLAASRPVVVAIEDLHWADPGTRELAEGLVELTDRAAVLVAVTYRADQASEAWRFRVRVLSEFAHRAVEVPVGPLPDEAAAELADALVPAGAIEDVDKRAIVARAEGNPLYLEELLRALIEAGGLARQRTWSLSGSPQELLPPALDGLLVARIDRLPAGARRLIQVAAVAGRTFPLRVLELLGESDDLHADLGILLRADMIRELRRFPEAEFTFKHGMLQKAVISTLVTAQRRALHGRVGAAFEELYAGSLDDHLEVLAHLYSRSDDLTKALDYLERAAARAAALHATPQAVELWRRAGKVAAKLGDRAAEERIEGLLSETAP